MWKGGGSDEIQLQRSLVETLEAPGSLAQATLPGIISDDISLCKDVGERYLWVDRLCIVQDDAASKMDQIQAMDAIYQSATFTIAAALNSNEGTGLPGYRNMPRYPTFSTPRPVHRPYFCRRSFEPNGWDESCRWNTRGWTFQEGLLSKRIIYITKHGVQFVCPKTAASDIKTWGFKNMVLFLRDPAAVQNDELRRKKAKE